METLETSLLCRLCGKQLHNLAIDILNSNENCVKKINAILPIWVHNMDLLPKYMCHGCHDKLKEFYGFYVNCQKTDIELKSRLSWMGNKFIKQYNTMPVPMVYLPDCKALAIKTELEATEFHDSSRPAEDNHDINRADGAAPCLPTAACCDSGKTIHKVKKESLDHYKELGHVSNNAKAIKRKVFPSRNIEEKLPKVERLSSTDTDDNLNDTFNVANTLLTVFKQENDFVRTLRPRRVSVDYKTLIKKPQRLSMDHEIETKDVKMLLPVDLKLCGKVEVKIEKLHAHMNYPVKSELIDDPIRHNLKSVRSTNRTKNEEGSASNVELRLKRIKIKLEKINAALYIKQRTSIKSNKTKNSRKTKKH